VDLRRGDCLLYRPKGFFGWVIATKTWHPVAHVEVYAGNDHSWASRDGLGVNLYPIRMTELAYVLRPTAPVDLARANRWAQTKIGTRYGWIELLNFVGVSLSLGGMFCSQFEVEYYRQGGWSMFPEDDAARVAPFENLNLVGAGFADVWHEEKRPVMWSTIGTMALRFALWCLHNPVKVEEGVAAAHRIVDAIAKAKSEAPK